MKRLAKFSLIFLPLVVSAQQIPLDTWRSHYSYSSARLLERPNNTLFCVAQNGLYTVDLETLETRKLGKENGLGDVAASAIHYAPSVQKLIIGYPSGLIDFISSDGTITSVTTLRDSPIVADKTILDITSAGEDVFLATSFGVVRANSATETVIENYRNIGSGGTQLSALEVEVNGDSLYVVSEEGIQAGSLQDNLLDFNEWVLFDETDGGEFEHLIISNDKLHAVSSGTAIWSFDGDSWDDLGISIPSIVRQLHSGASLLALTHAAVYEIIPGSSLLLTDPLLTKGSDIIANGSTYWIADEINGLLKKNSSTEVVNPASPLNDAPSRIKSVNGRTFAFYGPTPTAHTGSIDQLGYSYFHGGQWKYTFISGFYNITDVAAIGQAYFFSSMGFGLYDDSSITRLSESNSDLQVGNAYTGVQISALSSYGNAIWALGYNSPLSVYKVQADHAITGYTPTQTGFQYPVGMDITSQGVIWAIRSAQEGGGIGVFDPAIELKRTIRTADGLPANAVSGISIDTEDEAWIGTSDGIGTYSSASFPFNTFGVTIPIFENRFLFEDEDINDVMTDGGGRVWVATNEGIWVLAADLSAVVHRFTQANSPLPSDQVLSFAYEGLSGEVFILTSKGMVSYRSASSTAPLVHGPAIQVFPNPVRAEFDGSIGITGLVQDASLKVTDIMGRLVADLTANGGTASWDLRSFSGSRVQPGIYLLFSSSADGKETMVGKIAVLR